MRIIATPYQEFSDLDGSPLNGGAVYIGMANQNPITNPISVYWDIGGTQPAPQPLVTLNGYIVRAGTPANIFVDSNVEYSMLTQNIQGERVYYAQSSKDFDPFYGLSSTVPPFGTDLIGFSGSNLTGFFRYKNNLVVNSISDLRSVKNADFNNVFVSGYYASGDGGGGPYRYDSNDTTSPDNGGTIIVASDGGRWKLLPTNIIRAEQFGAKGDGSTDDSASIQSALDVCKVVYLMAKTYKTSSPLDFNNDGNKIIGEGRNLSIISYSGNVSAIRNPNSSTTTRLWCSLENLKIQAPTVGGGVVVDWSSMQLGRLISVWITGQSVLGCTAIKLQAIWNVTEATYNLIQDCYAGLCATCLSIGDGANSNTIIACRFQPSVSGGVGIILNGSSAGRVSNNQIISNGFEFPGQINVGVNIFQNTDGTVVIGNRFESLLNGIVIGLTSNKNVYAPSTQNYFSSCTTNINNAGSTGVATTQVASISINGTSSIVNGNPFNLSFTKNSTGNYTFTFLNARPNSSYKVSVSGAVNIVSVTGKTSTLFTVQTLNVSLVNTDTALLDVIVSDI